MTSILYKPAETELDILCNVSGTTTTEDMYATTPLVNTRPTYTPPEEEELHTSFEEAISDRVLAVNKRLRRLSVPLTDNLFTLTPMYTSVEPKSFLEPHKILKYASQQVLFKMAIAPMLFLVGFDLMGLLVLHMR